MTEQRPIIADPPRVRPGAGVTLEVRGFTPGDYLAVWDAGGRGDFEPAGTLVLSLEAPGVEGAWSPVAQSDVARIRWLASDMSAGTVPITCRLYDAAGSPLLVAAAQVRPSTANIAEIRARRVNPPAVEAFGEVEVTEPPVQQIQVQMTRTANPPDPLQALQTAIRASTNALSFESYMQFMDSVFCEDDMPSRTTRRAWSRTSARLRLPYPDTDAYRQLKVATEVFLTLSCGANIVGGEPAWARNLTTELGAESRRYGRTIASRDDILSLWDELMAQGRDRSSDRPPTRSLLYMALVRNKLRGVALTATSPRRNRRSVDDAVVVCEQILRDKIAYPCFLELIWSYWHEEGMLVQAMNAITWRFQNRRGGPDRDPLALLEIDPLRPLNNFIWGYIQDEQHRLTLVRRAYEYDHHYGLTLLGKAVPPVIGADSRTRFIEAFHNLLFLCAIFYKEDDDTTVVADGFPILNALKEVHLLLTQGAHNQYGDLPWTARQEMLMEQWMLARPEFREFLPRRIMVDYPEEWMDSVETMKTMQGWGQASVLHFRDLGVFGEQILLSIRFGAWPSEIESSVAANWARYWRPEIQGYLHGYRAVTGVDLTERADATMPALLLRQRLQAQGNGRRPQRRLPSGAGEPVIANRVSRPALPYGRSGR